MRIQDEKKKVWQRNGHCAYMEEHYQEYGVLLER